MVEGSPELVQLLLGDAFGVSRQNLVLNFIDGAGDGGEQLLPAHADVLERKKKTNTQDVSGRKRMKRDSGLCSDSAAIVV